MGTFVPCCHVEVIYDTTVKWKNDFETVTGDPKKWGVSEWCTCGNEKKENDGRVNKTERWMLNCTFLHVTVRRRMQGEILHNSLVSYFSYVTSRSAYFTNITHSLPVEEAKNSPGNWWRADIFFLFFFFVLVEILNIFDKRATWQSRFAKRKELVCMYLQAARL